MVTALEANAAAFLAVAVLGIGALMAGVSALSWRRIGHAKLLIVASAFAVLALKGALGVARALQGQAGDLPSAALDVAVVVLLYASVAAR